MRIVKDPDTRKQEILDAAIRVFATKGYEKTSIADIAKEINISQGLCYRYFASKEEMYDAAINEYADYIANINLSGENAGATLKEQILNMSGKVDKYSTLEQGQKDLYKLFHKEGNTKLHDELFLKVGEKLVPKIALVLKSAKERGEIKISDTDSAAYFFVFGQIGILMSTEFSEAEKTEKIQKTLIEMLGL